MDDQQQATDPDQGGQPHRRRRGLVWALVGVGLVVVLAGLYVGAHLMARGKVPAHTTVRGVDIGAMTREEAHDTLVRELGPRYDAPVTVRHGTTSATLKPSHSGLEVDWRATVAAAVPGDSWRPTALWNSLTGGGEVAPVTHVDKEKLSEAVGEVAPRFEVKATDATVSLDGTRIVTTKARPGHSLDVGATADRVRKTWRRDSTATVEAEVEPSAARIGDDTVAEVVADQLRPRIGEPLMVRCEKGHFGISREAVAEATTVKPDGDTIAVSTDLAALWKATQPSRDKLKMTTARDARIVIEKGKPVVKPSRDGTEMTQKAFEKAVGPALTATGKDRTVTVPLEHTKPDFTTEDAKQAGVRTVIGEFTTEFPHAAYRNTNLTLAANAINDTYLAPGDTFDLDKVLGPRDSAHGYVDGWVINGPTLVKESAGGVSQSATTTFNAAFFAGMTDVEHHPHSMYFSRYPAGREATLYAGKLNLRFRNDTKYGALVQAFTRKAEPGGTGSITVRIWSTPTWDKITSTDLKRSNYTEGGRIVSDDADCHPQSSSPGFDVHYARLFWRDGSVVKREKFFWRYDATDEVVCR